MAGLLPERGPEGAHVRLRLVSPNFYFLRDALLQGLGVGLTPDYMVQKALNQGALESPAPVTRKSGLSDHRHVPIALAHTLPLKAHDAPVGFFGREIEVARNTEN